MKIKVVVSVSDNYLWALRPFAYLFNKYWSQDQPVVIAGYSIPQFTLPDNFFFRSIAIPQYPKERWVDGLDKFLQDFNDDLFVLMLEDYWLNTPVDIDGVETLAEYANEHRDIIRLDLTGDRRDTKGFENTETYGKFQLGEAPDTAYQMSLQAAIWNKRWLLDTIVKIPVAHRSAWSFEMFGTFVLDKTEHRVVGTRQPPVRYINAMNNAKNDNIWTRDLPEEDVEAIRDMLPRNRIVINKYSWED